MHEPLRAVTSAIISRDLSVTAAVHRVAALCAAKTKLSVQKTSFSEHKLVPEWNGS